MATTNAQIISQYKQAHGLPLSYPLFTYAAWLKKGYRVREHEKCMHRVTMWCRSKKKNRQGEKANSGKCFQKVMALFTQEQVERIV